MRRMPRQSAIELFDTGMGLKEGEADPHWQIVARSDQPHFQPRPAVVTALPIPMWLANDCPPSQWISIGNNMPEVPNGVTFTFRTTFELRGMVPGTASLKGLFIADNHVNAIRLNGRPVPVPEHSDNGPFNRFHTFEAREGFVEGTNVLELDVYNGASGSAVNSSSAMGLRVELDGSVLSVGSDAGGTLRVPASAVPAAPTAAAKKGG